MEESVPSRNISGATPTLIVRKIMKVVYAGIKLISYFDEIS